MNGDRLERRRIEIELLVEGDIAGDRRELRREQRVAVGFGAIDRLGADIAAGAAAVLDHERLAQMLLEAGGENSRHGIDAAAGGHADDDFHRSIGIVGGRVLLSERRRHRQQRSRCCGDQNGISRHSRLLARADDGIAGEMISRARQCRISRRLR